MDKRYMHHLWVRLKPIKPWYFLVLALVSGVIGVYALRQNNLEMAHLRSAVFTADKNDTDVQKALQDLQAYVTSHMNTSLSAGPNAPYPPIQLQYTYDRAVQAAGEQTSAANAQIYTDAQHYCESKDSTDFYGAYRVQCVQGYITSHGITNLPNVPDALYKFDFYSPTWSPDLAGWSIVATILFFLLFATTWIAHWWLRRQSQ